MRALLVFARSLLSFYFGTRENAKTKKNSKTIAGDATTEGRFSETPFAVPELQS